MDQRNVPDSEGEITGFPYWALWEEFGEHWDAPLLVPEQIDLIERRFAAVRELDCPGELRITPDHISPLLSPLGLSGPNHEGLAGYLHLLAGVYLAPKHRKLLRSGAEATLKRLKHIRASATALNELLVSAGPETGVLLNRAHQHLVLPAVATDEFSRHVASHHLLDLIRAADIIIGEFPRRHVGPPTNILRERWIWGATQAIERYASEPVTALQFGDGARKSRLEGPTAAVLLNYLTLVEPDIKKGTIVRVISARRKVRAT